MAPYAADVDEHARYPEEAAAALQQADFHAPHVPEEYGGAGADALATVLVIEEVARVCVSSSLIPAVNKLGSLPVQLAGSEELKKHYLGALARGEGGFSYCLSEPEAGRRGRDVDPRGPRRRPLGAQRREAVDHQRRRLGVLHGHGRHRSRAAQRQGHLGVRRGEVRRGRQLRGAGEEARHQGLADPRGLPRQRADPGRPDDRRGGHRLRDRDAHPGPHPGHHRRPGRRGGPGRASTSRSATPRSASSSASRSPTSRASSSCSPTWA